MVIACKCKGCGTIHMNADTELTVELDFIDEKIRFVCPSCKTENCMDFESTAKRNKRQPLPSMSFVRG